MTAKRRSDMGAVLPWSPGGDAGSNGVAVRPLLDELRFGRHFRTASNEARHGCTCKGTEKVTRTTMAALPIVEAAPVGSILVGYGLIITKA